MDEMKSWQHGFTIDYLKGIEAFYEPHNKFALSPFGKMKKNDVAAKLYDTSLRLVYNDRGRLDAAFVIDRSKVPSKITMHGKTIIGEKQRGDVAFSRLVGDPLTLLDILDPDGEYGSKNCWLTTYAGNKEIRRVAERSGFEYIGYKVTSYAEVLAVYFRNDPMNFGPRKHPIVNPAELVGMAKIGEWNTSKVQHILDTIKAMCPVFTNHYSNYNQKDAWSALALRGYLNDPSFITKPAEMNDKWLEAHKHEKFELQDTKVYKYFDEVRELLSFLDGDVHRVRFMRLAPSGGELLRHTDQVDPDAGNSLGALARLHFPLKTNKKVIFSTWNGDDERETYHYGFGECWLIDTKKPHMAVNGGDHERIHLVVDTIVTPKLERMIVEGKSIQSTGGLS